MSFLVNTIRNLQYAMRKNKEIVVVEIGNDWLKIAEGKVSASGVYITKASFSKLAQIKEPISETIAKCFKDMKLNKRSVITYLPRHLATVRILELPSTRPEEISDMINLQIGKQTPYSKEEVASCYQTVGSDREDYTKAVLVIVRRSLIDERLNVLVKVGIEVDRVTLSSEGVFNWFKAFYLSKLKTDDLQAVILVDVDSNYSDFLVIQKGNLRFSKNILIGANQLIEEKDTYMPKFIEELKHSRDIFYEEWKAKLFLSGAASNIKDLGVILSAQLDLPCEIIDAVKDKAATNAAILKGGYPEFISLSPIYGILLKHKELSFNLMPSEMRIHNLMEEKRKNLTIMGVLFSAIMTIFSFLILIHIYNKNTYLTQIKQKIESIQGDSEEIKKMRLSIDLIQNSLDAKGDSLNLLDEIYKIIPKEIYLTSIDIERRKQVTLKGRALAMSDVFKFVTLLEKSSYFENVKNTYATTKKENNSEYADFEITAAYQNSDNRQ